MRRDRFQKVWDATDNRCRKINKTKGNDYAGDEDAFRNFKEVAARTGQDPLKVWLTYFSKHVMAVETFVQDGQVESEPIEGRIDDCITYLHLLHGMIEERKESPKVPPIENSPQIAPSMQATS